MAADAGPNADGGPPTDAGPGDDGAVGPTDAGDMDAGPPSGAARWVPDVPTYRWDQVVSAYGSGDDMGVAFAPSGDVVWGGALRGSANLGGGTRTVQPFQDGFVVQNDRDGRWEWDAVIGVLRMIEGVDLVRGIATDGDGNVYAAGSISDDFDFGGGLRTVDMQRDVFVVSYDPMGGYRWDRTFGSTERDTALDVVVTPGGDVCASGIFRFSVDFGGGTRTATMGTYSGFVLCLGSADGAYRWDRVIDGSLPFALAVDPDDNLTVAGSFRDPVVLEGTRYVSQGEEDVFLLGLDGADESERWSRVVGTTGRDWPNGVTADAAGIVTVTGLFAGASMPTTPADFGGGDRTSNGAADVFVASYGSDGAWRWDRTFGGTGWDGGEGDVAADPAGYHVLGVQMGSDGYDMGGGTRSGLIAVAAYDPDGEWLWDVHPAQSAPAGRDPNGEVQAVDVHSSGCVAVAGRFRGTTDFGGGGRTEDYSTTLPPFLWVFGEP